MLEYLSTGEVFCEYFLEFESYRSHQLPTDEHLVLAILVCIKLQCQNESPVVFTVEYCQCCNLS